MPYYVQPLARAVWFDPILRRRLNGYLDSERWVKVDGEQSGLIWDDTSLTAMMTGGPAEFFFVFRQANSGGLELIAPRFDIKIPKAKLTACKYSPSDVITALGHHGFKPSKIGLREEDGRFIFETKEHLEDTRDQVAAAYRVEWYKNRAVWTLAAMDALFGNAAQ